MSVPFYASMDIPEDLGQSPPGFDAGPVPISTYQETEPVPMSTYRETEPVPVSTYQQTEPVPITTYREKDDDFWENGFHAEDNNETRDPTPMMKDNNNDSSLFKARNENTAFTSMNADLNQLPAVPPFASGEGLPYAPVDFPNPGDMWTWRVGRRVSSAGFHQDRFLVLPPGLQKRHVPKTFASKPSLARYLQTEFPGTDVDAFFASFSWKIPASVQHVDKVDAASLFGEIPNEGQKEEVGKEETAQKDGKESTSRYSQRKRKPIQTYVQEQVEEKPKTTPHTASQKKRKERPAKTSASAPPPTSKDSKQKMRQSSRRATRRRGGAVDLNFLNDEAETGETPPNKNRKHTGDFEDEQVSIPHIYISPMNGVLAVSHSPVDINPEEFDDYLNSLDNLLSEPPQEEQVSALPPGAGSPFREYELTEARIKLSSLLEKDFPSLFYSGDVAELANLASKVRKDPSLSAEQIVRLKLVEEMPSFSEVYQENKGVIEEADKFFSSLELNKAKVASLKYEYSELKDKLTNIQTDMDSNSEAIRQIDEQISQLKARRAELTNLIGNKKKEKVDLNYAQKMVANSIPKVVQEVQSANSKRPEWELRKENALKREAEILSKFSLLKGFYL